ncbi:efflux RND transporter periplasmic adaptor subunit [Marinicauda algicola]|uniref:Efflux RND transporter periplasmic adaptor subunit n=1 Tax=Marinicauda algicola TaxID=2029849 RepID=A0A4S2H2R3_9PROT|nr:efflux RND transporter periplasmic adaptor subunit [Marinicauda algicola]TGY89628.1 efflux RND transporter periplasmic adaptor subunit [Marinicauda algicola]
MQRAAFLIAVLAVFAFMALAVGLRALFSGDEAEQGWGGRAVPVAVYAVETREFADVVEALGTAGANESVTVTAKVSDTIARINFDSGEAVEAGQILVELSAAEEAAGLSEARATLRETEREIARIRDLTERGVAPQSRLDEALAALERARARVEAIEARVADRIIRAPFAGTVGLREVSPGELVRPGDPIARLDDTRIIKLDFTVPERFLSVLEAGMQVEAATSAFPDAVFRGEITQIDSRVDPVTRAVTVRAEIDNRDGRLRPGQLMTVEVRRDVRESPAVPGSALLRYGDDVYVFVVREGERGSRAIQREVELGRQSGDLLEVRAGLAPGEPVVAEGIHRVRDGAPVMIAERLNASAAEGEGGGGERGAEVRARAGTQTAGGRE